MFFFSFQYSICTFQLMHSESLKHGTFHPSGSTFTNNNT
jgi:hypothetical protein